MAASTLLKDDWPLLAGGVLVIFVIFYALRGAGGKANTQSVSYQTVNADPNVLAAESQQQAARYGAVTSIVGAALGLEATQSTNATQLAEAQTQASAQEELGALQTEYQILGSNNALRASTIQSNDALQASQTQSNDQLSAQQAQAHASQQNGFWGSLFGGLGGLAKLFSGGSGGGGGYSGPDMADASFGSYA